MCIRTELKPAVCIRAVWSAVHVVYQLEISALSFSGLQTLPVITDSSYWIAVVSSSSLICCSNVAFISFLSRNNILDSVPQARKEPVRVLALLLDMLVHQRPDWTSSTAGISSSNLTVIQLRTEKVSGWDSGMQPLPLTEQLLCMFMAKLWAESLSYQTIKSFSSPPL